VVIVVLWLLILQNIIRFWPISKNAALLLVPYIIWVSFAAFLNYTLWRLNP
jgi:tryptophan-rich sensory protein